MTDVALALPFDDEQRLVDSAGRHGHRVVLRCLGAEELAGRIGSVAVELALVAADPQYLTARLVRTCDASGVRLVAVAAGAGAVLARSLGVLEVMAAPADWPALEAGPTAEPVVPEVAAPRAIRGEVTAVWGPAGAPGRTAVAIAIAAELAAAGRSVALADADTHAASIAPALGLLDEAPGFAAACRLAGLDALDAAELDRVAQVHRSRLGAFRVLTGLGRPSRWPELPADRVRATLVATRSWVEHTVVDVAASIEEDEELSSDLVAPRRNAATLAALRAADRVVVVGSADPIGLSRLLHAHADLLEAIDPPEVVVVVNRVRASAIGMNPQGQIRQTLLRFGGIDDPVLVPDDRAAFDAALLGGETLADAAPRSPARTAVRELVAGRMLPPAPAAERPRRARRRAARIASATG